MSNNSANIRAQLARLASSTNPEIAALARIVQTLVPQTPSVPQQQQQHRNRNLQGAVDIDDTTVIAKSALDVDYQAAIQVIENALENRYSRVNKLWVMLSTDQYRWKSIAPESWKELLPLITKVKTSDPYHQDWD